MERTLILLSCLASLCIGCNSGNNTEIVDDSLRDSIETEIADMVMAARNLDSLLLIPSLKYSNEAGATYVVKQYIHQEDVVMINIEDLSEDFVKGTDIYYHKGQPIFVSDYQSTFTEDTDEYTERMIFINNQNVHQAYIKHSYAEGSIFDDTLFEKTTVDFSSLDFEKPLRALQQKGEFEMYFDQFLLLEPQTYLILENADSSLNAAIFIKSGDSLLNQLFENPKSYEKQKIWVNHYFEEMNGIERMIYNGSRLLND